MIPFADFTFFGVLIYPAIPTIAAGLSAAPARLYRPWLLLVTAGMAILVYSATAPLLPEAPAREIWVIAAFFALEYAVARSLLWQVAESKLDPARAVLAPGRFAFPVAVVLALAPLAIAKFVPLAIPGSFAGFLGISYVTFRALDVIFCIRDGLISELPVGQYFAYLFFFATVSAGPIDRYRRFEADWRHSRTREEFLHDLDAAVHKLFVGLGYKFILAALIQRYWLEPAGAGAGILNTVSYMYAYSFYLFFDFAGYSAFAIGVSYLFGIHTPENFNRPFLARDIADFWNRWHITLSWWLRDHVYMRFVLAARKQGWIVDRHTASYAGFALSFGLMGLWHGTAAHYLLYGFYHAALMIGHEAFGRWNKRHRVWGEGPAWTVAGIAITFQAVCFGFLLFSGRLG